MKTQSCVPIKNEWDIVKARQLGRDISKDLGFGHVDQARIATAISELARNIYLYAKEGQVAFEVSSAGGQSGLKILATDKGPGISDLRKVMQDGYTTSGGLGAGLPGVRRLMDEFTILSKEGQGTEIVTIKYLRE